MLVDEAAGIAPNPAKYWFVCYDPIVGGHSPPKQKVRSGHEAVRIACNSPGTEITLRVRNYGSIS